MARHTRGGQLQQRNWWQCTRNSACCTLQMMVCFTCCLWYYSYKSMNSPVSYNFSFTESSTLCLKCVLFILWRAWSQLQESGWQCSSGHCFFGNLLWLCDKGWSDGLRSKCGCLRPGGLLWAAFEWKVFPLWCKFRNSNKPNTWASRCFEACWPAPPNVAKIWYLKLEKWIMEIVINICGLIYTVCACTILFCMKSKSQPELLHPAAHSPWIGLRGVDVENKLLFR